MWTLDPRFLLLVSALQLNFYDVIKVIMKSKFKCDAETKSKNRGSEAHINWTCPMWTG